MADNIITDVFFRLANLFVLLGFCFYLFKKYGLKALRQRVEKHHATTARLNESFRTQKEINEQRYDWYHKRELLFETLKLKLERWRGIQENHAKEVEKNIHIIATKVEQQAAKTTHYRALMRAKKVIAHQVIARARILLEQKYTDENEKKYIEQTISYMHKVTREKP